MTLYEQSQALVKQYGKIGDQVFVYSHLEYSSDIQGLRDTFEFSMLTPFKSQRGLSKQASKKIFLDSANRALARVRLPDLHELEKV
jgi:hypothetical protein